jgi:hypothetical protein
LYCNYCRNNIPKDAVFCPKCGKKINKSTFINKANNSDKTIKNDKPPTKPVQADRINIDEIYRELKILMDKRAGLQEYQDNLWAQIKRDHVNRTNEMQNLNRKIGDCNHKINLIISKLTRYKKKPSAMKLAYDFVTSEIERNNKILEKWRNLIYDVDRGYRALIDSSGITTYDTNPSRKYADNIEKKIERYLKTQTYLSNYI